MKDTIKACFRKPIRRFRIKIRSGPCQGLLWSFPTRLKFIRGAYEPKLANFVAATLRPDDVFWDVGAHFGYYTLLASRIVRTGDCLAFEPKPDNRWYLEHHLHWNRLAKVTMFPYAIAATDGMRRFGGGGTGSNRLDGGDLIVQTRSVDSLVQSKTCRAPSFMKIDVEGAETEVLTGEVLRDSVGIICLATHGNERHSECHRKLTDYGYNVHDFRERRLIIAINRKRVVPDAVMKIIST